jgi:serine/arginine repetitive matrix protein 1
MSTFKGVPAGEGLAAAHKRRVLEQLKKEGGGGKKNKSGGGASGVPAEYLLSVDMSRVALAAVRPWVTRRVRELLGGLDEEVLVGMLLNTLDDAARAAAGHDGGSVSGGALTPLDLHVQLEPFLEGQTTGFVRELWSLLHSASGSATGVPQVLLDKKAAAMAAARGGGGGGAAGAVDAAAAAAAAVAAARAIGLRAAAAAAGGGSTGAVGSGEEGKGGAAGAAVTTAPAARRRSRWDVAEAPAAEGGERRARSRSRSPAPRS